MYNLLILIMRKLIIEIARKNRFFKFLLLIISNKFLSNQNKNVLRWKLDNGDNTLRINYPLKSNSIVFDVGGYVGDWSWDIYKKYKCNIYIFEPVKEFYEIIKKRFSNFNKIQVLNYGLESKNRFTNIYLADDATSIYQKSNRVERIKLVGIKDALSENKVKKVDLIKLNVEGGEYEILEYLIRKNLIKNFKNVQVQFHRNVKNAELRANKIQENMAKTHRLTYQYPFVWENWFLKDYRLNKKK